jgi:hypothetical protein
MGNSYTKFKEAEVGSGNVTGKLGKCISPAIVSKEPMKLTIKANTWAKQSTVTDDATGAVILTTKVSMGFNKVTVSVYDASGAEVCIVKGSKGLTSGSFQVFKSSPAFSKQAKQEEGYVFSSAKMKIGLGTCDCTYSLVQGGDAEAGAVPLYDVHKVGRFGLCMTFTNQEGTLVAKYAQPGLDVKHNIAEIGANVDVAAVCVIAGMVGLATGSGGATAGALAGAGVV